MQTWCMSILLHVCIAGNDSNWSHNVSLTLTSVPIFYSVLIYMPAMASLFTFPKPLAVYPLSLAATFDMTPSPLNVAVEQRVATFHCQHNSCDDISWRVNGTFPNSPNITTEGDPLDGGGYWSSLFISTLLGFNETTIECVAVFFDVHPLQFTTPVTLLIQG